jgi:hypothetical protein
MISLACFSSAAQRNPPVDLQRAVPDLAVPDPLVPDPVVPVLDLPFIATTADDRLPDAPTPNNGSSATPQQGDRQTSPGYPPISPMARRLPPSPAEHPSIPSLPSPCQAGLSTSTPTNISCSHDVDYFNRFVDAGIHPLTARQKGILAFRNTVNPYNFATIGFFSAISVASDPNSAYGPGMPGFGRNFGVAYCETAVSEFFGTFLVPAIAHQDPHYHRMPNASYPRRALHAVTQVVWAQSDYGVGMPNYSTLITTAVGDGLGNLYVPGRDKSWGSAAARYTTAIATDPIDNFVTEFLPDVARRVNIRIVLIQQIVNHVEKQQ